MSQPTLLSIGTCNRRAGLAAVAESFVEHHPFGRVFICLVDRPHAQMPPLDLPAETFYADELPLPGGRRFLFKYESFELCCALKPYAMRHVLHSYGASPLVYLDSDILVTHRFWQDLESEWSTQSVLLTPHLTRLPSELDPNLQRSILQHGGYNGGFIGVKGDRDSDRFLDWWAGLLQDRCTFDPMNNIYVDQRWLDLAAASCSAVGVMRESGLNVAYWNLHERRLEEGPEHTWSVDGQPLKFFHFSGFDSERLTTKIDHPDPRASKIAAHYGRLLDQAGEKRFGRFPYGWACYSNGEPIPTSHRDLVLSHHPELLRVDDPFSFPENRQAWEALQTLSAERHPARIGRHYVQLQEALANSQRQLDSANAALQRLRDHPVIGRVWQFWRRYINPALDGD